MIMWLLATMGTAAVGSVFPLVNIELYLISVLSTVDGLAWWALALAATVGQLSGKILVFFAGKGSFTLGKRLSKTVEDARAGRWARWLDTFHQRNAEHPLWGLGMLFLSAVVSFPPFTLLCFLVGAAGTPFLGFLAVSFVGRAIHFLLVAGAPGFLENLGIGLPALFQ